MVSPDLEVSEIDFAVLSDVRGGQRPEGGGSAAVIGGPLGGEGG